MFNWRLIMFLPVLAITHAQGPVPASRPSIPRTWDDEQIASLEVALANPAGSPKHVSADYYYKIPVRPIYKQYSVVSTRKPPCWLY